MTLFVLLSAALAGDPCPISLEFAEYTPEWRDRAADLSALESNRTWLGLSYGSKGQRVLVKSVIPGSPAEKGLEIGDWLLRLNNVPIKDVAHLNALLDAPSSQGDLQLTVKRGDSESVQDITVVRAPADPVFLGLINAAENQECRQVRVLGLSEEQRASVLTGAFDDNKAFRCEDAHHRLKGFDSGTVLMVRGGHRILLSMPGWNTECVGVNELDGIDLTLSALKARVDSLSGAYVADRHDNP